MRTVRDIVWAAALIEGEGCIVAGEYRSQREDRLVRQFRLAVEMTDLDILVRLRGILGPQATLRERRPPSVNPKHRRRYILVLTGCELAGWLMTIYPIMGERRQTKIRSALTLWKKMRTNWRHANLRQTPLRIVA
jgi:hypothetical protein